jgi:hypothetical protein
MKIYIDKNLTPRYSPNGWPDKKSFVDYENDFHVELYDEALAKAKADSVPFESICETFHFIDKALGMPADKMPDTFIEVDIGEVEVVEQYKNHDWKMREDCDERGIKPWHLLRKIARMKKPENGAHGYTEGSEIPNALIEKPGPDKIRCDCELFVDKYFGLPSDFPVDSLVPEAQYFQLVNLLSMFRDEQLAAANKRIAELENDLLDALDLKMGKGPTALSMLSARIKDLEQWQQEELIVWGPILDYCQDDKNAKRLGIVLGQSISTRVLEILKKIK